MPEWAPGLLGGLLKKIDTAGVESQRQGLLTIAAAIEAKAKAKLSETSHPKGTPTPATRGGPPSLVTGTGRRSIGVEHVAGVDLLVKIGTFSGVFPPGGSTASSKYLLYQETLPKFNHPFLVPSYRSVIREDAVRIWLESFRRWPKL